MSGSDFPASPVMARDLGYIFCICVLGADFVVSYLAVVIDFFLKFKREIKLNIDVFLVR